MTRAFALHAGWCAAAVFLVAVLVADALQPAARVPMLAEYGAAGAASAWVWNALGFVLPGLLVAVFAVALEGPMRTAGAGRAGRIGSTLLLLSGVFFAAQGLLPYDLDDPDARRSQLHVATLTLGLLAFLPGSALVAASLRRASAWQLLRLPGGLLPAAVLACLLAPPGAWMPALRGEPGLAQRMVLALYFGWVALAAIVAWRAGRRSG